VLFGPPHVRAGVIGPASENDWLGGGEYRA
jgi:hypothetical protein